DVHERLEREAAPVDLEHPVLVQQPLRATAAGGADGRPVTLLAGEVVWKEPVRLVRRDVREELVQRATVLVGPDVDLRDADAVAVVAGAQADAQPARLDASEIDVAASGAGACG